ncbi:unnamed protein product, partial [Rotaria socialis]
EKATQQNNAKEQQKQQNPTSTWQKNVETSSPHHAQDKRTITEHTTTPYHMDDVSEQENDERNDESLTNNDNMDQDNTSAVNKRTLNDSDDFISVGSNRVRKNVHVVGSTQVTKNQRNTTNNESNYTIPLDHLQRAVIHNLPCFVISFRELDKLLSAVIVSEDLHEHFDKHKVQIINGFSVVRYIGNQLKIGVKNQDDYQTLCDYKVWPVEIQGDLITVTIPKFIPEQFSLVVRFIPLEITTERVAEEIKRSASTANNFRAVVYPYYKKDVCRKQEISEVFVYNEQTAFVTFSVLVTAVKEEGKGKD